MSINHINVLLPIKEDSQRLPNKNFVPFGNEPLFEFMVKKLLISKRVKCIYINTDAKVIKQRFEGKDNRVQIIDRPNHLLGHDVTMNSIIDNDLSLIPEEHFLQTHCTNPLLTIHTIDAAIDKYFADLLNYDSLYTVDKIQKRVYDVKNVPINHSNDVLLPTQVLPPVLVENSNIFIFSRSSFYNNHKSRIGIKPQAFAMHPLEGTDIDYPEDYALAKLIHENRNLFPTIFGNA